MFKVFVRREFLEHFFVDILPLPFPKTLRWNLWQRHELDSDRLLCDILMMMCCCCFQVRRSSSASPRVFSSLLELVFVFSSICASTFRKRVLLSLFIVDKAARGACVTLSCVCLVIFPCLIVMSSPTPPSHFWFARWCHSIVSRVGQHLPRMLFGCGCLSSVSASASAVGSVLVPVPVLLDVVLWGAAALSVLSTFFSIKFMILFVSILKPCSIA